MAPKGRGGGPQTEQTADSSRARTPAFCFPHAQPRGRCYLLRHAARAGAARACARRARRCVARRRGGVRGGPGHAGRRVAGRRARRVARGGHHARAGGHAQRRRRGCRAGHPGAARHNAGGHPGAHRTRDGRAGSRWAWSAVPGRLAWARAGHAQRRRFSAQAGPEATAPRRSAPTRARRHCTSCRTGSRARCRPRRLWRKPSWTQDGAWPPRPTTDVTSAVLSHVAAAPDTRGLPAPARRKDPLEEAGGDRSKMRALTLHDIVQCVAHSRASRR